MPLPAKTEVMTPRSPRSPKPEPKTQESKVPQAAETDVVQPLKQLPPAPVNAKLKAQTSTPRPHDDSDGKLERSVTPPVGVVACPNQETTADEHLSETPFEGQPAEVQHPSLYQQVSDTSFVVQSEADTPQLDAEPLKEESMTAPGKKVVDYQEAQTPSSVVVRRGSTSTSNVACAEDLKCAESIAKNRGLPPEMELAAVRDFLLPYGYDAIDHQSWSKPADQQPVCSINLTNHIEFGDHTQYELICKVLPRSGGDATEISWRTLRRLKHIRAGLHDPMKAALGSQYNRYFGDAPFAHHSAPAGTTARLKAWFACVSSCINSGGFEPSIVARTFRLLDGPGTPLSAEGKFSDCISKDFEQIPITAAMFGSRNTVSQQMQVPIHSDLPRLALGRQGGSCLEVAFDVNGCERKIQVQKRPLGAEFSKLTSGPLRVARVKPKSHAAELGVEAGWVVKSVGGADVSDKTYQQMQDALKTGVMHLPLATQLEP